ncbi:MULTISPECIES: LppM family (lipo)protein [unclassified Rhodococcus (in: high G+C Gram-positive bacteria)]|uniref:LppM family (lipo)protein n=1 Tax=unclassified Rhodococcus (in: high G+C Gram-positive bacteria) TaxID=192944 RepID=UPI00163966DE|nr:MULTISPECIES: DUF3153 domain-containing protein [unclassified Rhodococcus (in: high G+C Gram-positive bacteria)]MBC2638561.1 DUF3153 domain-containing protein [Rhodococcus sp. 3A]MBC2896698.1 DUF3153 domain-containing protein [Rhodococcus sp. 4CII]
MQLPSVPTSTRSRRAASLAVLGLLLVPFLAGCLRVQVSMGVSADDRVSGQIVAAAVPANDQDKGPQLTPPVSLSDKVRIQEYKKDGYVGSQAFFSDLTFGDVQQLGTMSEQATGSFQISLQRTGDLVTLDGKADLSSVPAQGSDVQFTIAFPARVATTNGTREGDSIVSWKLPAGDTSTIRAEVRYSDPSTRSFAGWAGIMAGVTLGVAVIVGALAWLARNKDPVAGSRRTKDHSEV